MILLQLNVRNMGETDSHWRAISDFLDGSQVNRIAAIAGAEFVEGGIEAAVFLGGLLGFRFIFRNHGGEKLWGEIVLLDQVRECDGDLDQMRAWIGSLFPELS